MSLNLLCYKYIVLFVSNVCYLERLQNTTGIIVMHKTIWMNYGLRLLRK